jgi:hypothetical protein
MEQFYIAKTKYSPLVILNNENGEFQFSGRSLPEDAWGFYKPVIDWINLYIENPNQSTILSFEFEYLNSASSKVIIEIINMMSILIEKGLNVKVNWRYCKDDDSIMETGKIFANSSEVPFDFIIYNE